MVQMLSFFAELAEQKPEKQWQIAKKKGKEKKTKTHLSTRTCDENWH